ncbi:DUF6587 family protein [Acinetobacter sp. WZC-1]|uniref:DUF6587 family protein n=1 Tax=Acinetobacter sp. WZC-1 TaxID=3459034 RepID=UPI00403DACD6
MVELLIVAALVGWSAIFVFKKVLPKTAYSVFFRMAEFCRAKGWTALAKWLQPAMVAGCGGSCGCSSSESESTQKTTVQAVKWK